MTAKRLLLWIVLSAGVGCGRGGADHRSGTGERVTFDAGPAAKPATDLAGPSDDRAPPADVSKPPADAVVTPSGLIYEVVEPGTGAERPRPWDTVTYHVTGWTSEGRWFFSTHVRDRPLVVHPFERPPGFAQALELMVVGQRNRYWMPEALRWKGSRDPPGVDVYDIELVALEKNPDPPAPPEQLTHPPRGAKKTASGVFVQVLKQGRGKRRAGRGDTVLLNYTGWNDAGKLFTTSVTLGKPARVPLYLGRSRRVRDMVVGMVEGEVARFWVPVPPTTRAGGADRDGAGEMVVYQVELVEIVTAPGPE